MTKSELKFLHSYFYFKYCSEMHIYFIGKDDNDFGSYISEKMIVIPKSVDENPTEWSLFAFLHEIGHIKTNTIKMKRCEQEYLATKWALEEAKTVNFKVSKEIIKVYQNYIWDWREKGIKRGAKTIPSKKSLCLS